MTDQTDQLKQTLSLPLLVLYGLGTTIGAGIYALVGKLAGMAGYQAPLAFLVASIIAGFTALSFAELSGRFPKAAGAALYVQEGLRSARFARVVGLLVALAGIVSSAALLNAFVGYFNEFVVVHRWLIIVIATVILAALAVWGIKESVVAAGIFTLVEIGGLVLIISVGMEPLVKSPTPLTSIVPSFSWQSVSTIFSASILAFYAFIGFEDMVDVAEEVKSVKKTLPIAILLTLAITTVLYLLVMVIAVFAMPMTQLAQSQAPLADLYQHVTGKPATVITGIGLFAIINGALIQIIMASRVLYGLSRRHQLPKFLGRVNRKTKTPINATLIVTSIILIIALSGKLSSLAKGTSLLMLLVFAFVNLALVRIKYKQGKTTDSLCVPYFVPVLGFITSCGFVGLEFTNLF